MVFTVSKMLHSPLVSIVLDVSCRPLVLVPMIHTRIRTQMEVVVLSVAKSHQAKDNVPDC